MSASMHLRFENRRFKILDRLPGSVLHPTMGKGVKPWVVVGHAEGRENVICDSSPAPDLTDPILDKHIH